MALLRPPSSSHTRPGFGRVDGGLGRADNGLAAYTDLQKVFAEVEEVEQYYKHKQITRVDITGKSVEDQAQKILSILRMRYESDDQPSMRGDGGGAARHGGGGGGTWASRPRKHSEAGYGRPVDRGVWTAKTVKRPRQQPAQPPIRQVLGAADAQTAHPATFSTASAHQLLGSANAETTPAGAPAAAADRTQRPDATCEGESG